MSSNGTYNGSSNGERSAGGPDTAPAEAALNARLTRKRTKTGCLTCRKRRIKCDEGDPVCRNCVKSKRECEGYSQRVVFKHPTFDHRVPNGSLQTTFRPDAGTDQGLPYGHDHRGNGTEPALLHQQHRSDVPRGLSYTSAVGQYEGDEQYGNCTLPALFGPLLQAGQTAYEVPPSYVASQPQQAVPDAYSRSRNHVEPVGFPAQSLYMPTNGAAREQSSWLPPDGPLPASHWLHTSLPPMDTVVEAPVPSVPPKAPTWTRAPIADPWAAQLSQPSYTSHFDPSPSTESASSHMSTYLYTKPPPIPIMQHQYEHPPELFRHVRYGPSIDTTDTLLKQAAVERQDDDYYDVDEEVDFDTMESDALDHEHEKGLQRVLRVNNISISDFHTRRYDTFMYAGMLDHYRAEEAASPLKNPATARVFAHFIAVTAPSLSVFERHPRSTSVLFTEGQVPESQRGLWTYTMPTKALRHQGLLHSMLALASLHIARLQNASDTPSRQHYAWACKRINGLLGSKSKPKQRHATTTIATSMLLGFYEIFTADHRAWNTHLAGSKQLFRETDFMTLSRQFRAMRREAVPQSVLFDDSPRWTHDQSDLLSSTHDVDDTVVSKLVGQSVSYDSPPELVIAQPLDLSHFEILRDLYWWYLKQDAVQSVVSGNPLLLDYNLWPNCPPRAPIGKPDAVYGSHDHLVLLLGRIADFSARDRKRKLRQMNANGGQWRPPGTPMAHPGHQAQTSLSAADSRPTPRDYFQAAPQPHQAQQPQQPHFYGMAPAPRQNVQMPSAYYPTSNDHLPPPPQTPAEELDLPSATAAALEEHRRIREALRLFETNLTEAFQPLPPEFTQAPQTPFGPALIYRSYDIGCLWAMYYTALIIAIRSHPHMHPAAHVAAFLSAAETSFYANEIGRINAGIVTGPPEQPLNPTLGAALWDSCIPAFFAAIQYQTLPQRNATVRRIHDIGVRTGWGTAEIIANGCETAWVRAAEAGRGEPYVRIARVEFSDDPRLSGRMDGVEVLANANGGGGGVAHASDSVVGGSKAGDRLMFAQGLLGTKEDAGMQVRV